MKHRAAIGKIVENADGSAAKAGGHKGRPYRSFFEFMGVIPPIAAAEARWTFGEKGGQMFERSEFLSARQTSAERREPAQAGQTMGCPFSAYSF